MSQDVHIGISDAIPVPYGIGYARPRSEQASNYLSPWRHSRHHKNIGGFSET